MNEGTQPAHFDILCIGSVLWDVVGRTRKTMVLGNDVPGQITRVPGGVALNIAMTLARHSLRPTLLSAVGQDHEGAELIAACAALDLETRYVYRPADLPTDAYMAVEGTNGLIAAIADARSLEDAGDKILTPLFDGSLGSLQAPFSGLIALDGNLTLPLLDEIAQSDAFGAADLRIAPASPGKADRLAPFLTHARGTLYVNLEEAEILCGQPLGTSAAAAAEMRGRGANRVLVTNGSHSASFADAQGVVTCEPPAVTVTRITGAGDTFMAAHIAAETRGEPRAQALTTALKAAADYVSGEPTE